MRTKNTSVLIPPVLIPPVLIPPVLIPPVLVSADSRIYLVSPSTFIVSPVSGVALSCTCISAIIPAVDSNQQVSQGGFYDMFAQTRGWGRGGGGRPRCFFDCRPMPACLVGLYNQRWQLWLWDSVVSIPLLANKNNGDRFFTEAKT